MKQKQTQAQLESQDVPKTKILNLRKIPMDVYKMILEQQGIKKAECGCQYSMEQTVYMLIRRACRTNETKAITTK